jgi:hypothetical protein
MVLFGCQILRAERGREFARNRTMHSTSNFTSCAFFSLLLACTSAACSTATGADPASGDDEALKESPLAPGEPLYCVLSNLRAHEISIDTHGLKNAHAYKLGDVTLVGVAVGESEVDALQSLAAKTASSLTPDQRSCTFYYNDGHDAAEEAFNWHNIPKPLGKDYAGMTDQYASLLGDVFDTSEPSFLSCAATAHYVAMGCDGMQHRGPTVFAATLAYSGCSPEHATGIVNSIWGKNGIEPQMRISIATWAQSLAASHPDQSAKLRGLFLGQSE